MKEEDVVARHEHVNELIDGGNIRGAPAPSHAVHGRALVTLQLAATRIYAIFDWPPC